MGHDQCYIEPQYISTRCQRWRNLILALLFILPCTWAQSSEQKGLCLDGFCIGQTIHDLRFDEPAWISPKGDLQKEACKGIGCTPGNALRGYPLQDQIALADALSWHYGLNGYNIITNDDIQLLRRYKYECDPSARTLGGQRRFLGLYRSTPTGYLTIVGLRLINGELKVYRIARQYPAHNQAELSSLARDLRRVYGERVLLYDGISSNAYSDVIAQRKDGWFGRSTVFNPTDLSDNAAELVLVDPQTRTLLEPSSMPDSGEIQPLPMRLPESCSRNMPIH
jgi:hypothetical protein